MAWKTPITDRSQTDIDEKTVKAFFNILDWARVYGNSQVVNSMLTVLRGLNVPFTVLSDPTITSFPTVEDVNQLIQNIENLRAASSLPETLGTVELKTNFSDRLNSPSPNFEDVNDWERNLKIIREFTFSISTYMIFSGIAEVGQPRFWQNRFLDMFVHEDKNPVRRARTGIATCGASALHNNKFRRYSV